MDKVEIYYARENGKTKVGINIKDHAASLEDLLQVWQFLSDDSRIFKIYARNNYASCRGCAVNCCNTAYVIPDLIAFKKMAHYLQADDLHYLSHYFQKEKVNNGLLRLKPDPCIFLENNICTVYPFRSLTCRFYICTDILGETEQLIYSINWAGITATQLTAEKMGLIKPAQSGFSSFDLMIKGVLEEYRNRPQVQLFINAREYRDIPLFPFINHPTR